MLCSYSILTPVLTTHLLYRMYFCNNISVRILLGFFGISQLCIDTPFAVPCSYLASISYLRINPCESALGRYFLSISIPLNMFSAGIGYSSGLINPLFAVITGNSGISFYQMMLQVGALGSCLISSELCCMLLVESFAEYDRSLT